jgi:uncharacterized membrane protein
MTSTPTDPSDPRPLRGREMTRLETFTDAAFAFAVTLLAISIDEIPDSYEGLIAALKGTPAFAASFAMLLLYWRAHQNWSQRYGLEDLPAVLLTFALVLVVMVYVYPLKIMFGAAFDFLTGGWLPSGFELESVEQFRSMVAIYGIGFFTLSALVGGLYLLAWMRREALAMGPAERLDTATEAIAWFFVSLFGIASLVLGQVLPDDKVFLAPWIYATLSVLGPLIDLAQRRLARRRGLASAPFGRPAKAPDD